MKFSDHNRYKVQCLKFTSELRHCWVGNKKGICLTEHLLQLLFHSR